MTMLSVYFFISLFNALLDFDNLKAILRIEIVDRSGFGINFYQ